LLSKELGAPVKVQWTREDDVHHDFLHTVSVERIEAGLDKSGKVIAWRHRSVAPTIASNLCGRRQSRGTVRARMGLIDNPFEIANLQCENRKRPRSRGSAWFPLGVQHPARLRGAIDGAEIALATNRDPKDMLLELIGSPRIVNLSSVKDPGTTASPMTATRSTPAGCARSSNWSREGEWGRKVPKGHGLGIAVHRSFVSYIATIVEVAVDEKGKLTVPRVDTRLIAAPMSTPERIHSQIEGAAIMGLSLAKHGEISFKDGKVQQSNFDDFPVIRIDESPAITNVHIVPPAAAHRERRRRTRRTAVRTGPDQRDLCRHRQAHPEPADRQAAGGVTRNVRRDRPFLIDLTGADR